MPDPGQRGRVHDTPQRAFPQVYPCYNLCVPKTGGRRYLPVRISDQGYAALKKRAEDESSGNVSELVRRMLKFALTNMPKGWT